MRSITDLSEQLKKLHDFQSIEQTRHSESLKRLQQDVSDLKSESRLKTDILKKLQGDSTNHLAEIKFIQLQIDNCAGCQHGGAAIVVESCENSNPCFRGVECRDTVSGMVCGNCPRGYVGDGRNCQRVEICDDKPCFE